MGVVDRESDILDRIRRHFGFPAFELAGGRVLIVKARGTDVDRIGGAQVGVEVLEIAAVAPRAELVRLGRPVIGDGHVGDAITDRITQAPVFRRRTGERGSLPVMSGMVALAIWAKLEE